MYQREVIFLFERNHIIPNFDDIAQMYFAGPNKFFFTGIASKRRMRKIN
jgi:hypothetical protein